MNLVIYLRKTDILARLGSDEFGLLLPMPIRASTTDCQYAAGRIYTALWGRQNVFYQCQYRLSGARCRHSKASVLSAAYAACMPPKQRAARACTNDDSELAQQRGEMQWVSRITKALENHFRLYSQRIVLANREKVNIVSFCAWRMKPAKSSPMAFIPAAERYQLMHLIDRWVISTLLPIWAVPGNGSRCRIAQSLCRQPLWR